MVIYLDYGNWQQYFRIWDMNGTSKEIDIIEMSSKECHCRAMPFHVLQVFKSFYLVQVYCAARSCLRESLQPSLPLLQTSSLLNPPGRSPILPKSFLFKNSPYSTPVGGRHSGSSNSRKAHSNEQQRQYEYLSGVCWLVHLCGVFLWPSQNLIFHMRRDNLRWLCRQPCI